MLIFTEIIIFEYLNNTVSVILTSCLSVQRKNSVKAGVGCVFLNSELIFYMFVLCTQSVGSCLAGKSSSYPLQPAACTLISPLKAVLQMQQYNCLNTFEYILKEDLLQIKRDCFFKINNVLLQPSRQMTSTPEFKN